MPKVPHRVGSTITPGNSCPNEAGLHLESPEQNPTEQTLGRTLGMGREGPSARQPCPGWWREGGMESGRQHTWALDLLMELTGEGQAEDKQAH